MKTFDIAMIGCGGVSPMHFLGCRAHSERVRIVAACDPDKERLKHAQSEYGFEHAFTCVDELIANAEWDVGVVCTPTPVREEVVSQLAAAGKHIFIEKPFADTYEEAARMVDACDKAGVRISVDQNFRYHWPFHIAKRAIEDGTLGKVLSIFHQDMFFRQDVGWRTKCERHALAIMGVHWLDGFRWTLGCEARSIVSRMSSSPAIECAGETEAFSQIVFENGTAVSYVESFSSPIFRAETLIIGENGMMVLDYNGAALFAKDNPKEPKRRWDNPYKGVGKVESAFMALNELLLSIEQGTEAPNSGRDNLKTIALLEGAYRSANEQQIVYFKEGDLL